MQRREFLLGASLSCMGVPLAAARPRGAFGGEAFRRGVAELEADSGGRLGLAIHDRHSGARFASRGDERFAMCSTFKMVLGAAILAKVERGGERLDRAIPIAAADIIANSPMTEKRVGATATVAEMCEATITLSDNAAANLLLPAVGGPAGLTRFMRAQRDSSTRLDRYELDLNEARPGDPRDTTTPAAMLALLDRLAFGRGLSPASQRQLIDWMLASKTGAKRLRAGLPADWRIADKTGAGNRSNNEVAILWPPGRKPILVASYIAGTPLDLAQSNVIHARLGTLIAAAL